MDIRSLFTSLHLIPPPPSYLLLPPLLPTPLIPLTYQLLTSCPIAHTTQFTRPGIHYLSHGNGVGFLNGGGSYVTFFDKETKDFTVVIETMVRVMSLGDDAVTMLAMWLV